MAGNCLVGGYYTNGSGFVEAFVVGQQNGSWGNAEEVPGSATLNVSGYAEVNSVSCGSAGNCAVGGFYQDEFGHNRAFVASEVNGRWGKAKDVTLYRNGNPSARQAICRHRVLPSIPNLRQASRTGIAALP